MKYYQQKYTKYASDKSLKAFRSTACIFQKFRINDVIIYDNNFANCWNLEEIFNYERNTNYITKIINNYEKKEWSNFWCNSFIGEFDLVLLFIN